MAKPFLLLELNRLPRGRLIDVGCGNGGNLLAAEQLGWVVRGLEIDQRAVATARAAGLDVIQGDYKCLDGLREEFDCLICSHVIEHVHEPLALLRAIYAALKSGGVALISLPNADSRVLDAVAENWRGLEAPRHLAIPTAAKLCDLFEELGFLVVDVPLSPSVTLQESLRIAERRGLDRRALLARFRDLTEVVGVERSDFINLVLKKP